MAESSSSCPCPEAGWRSEAPHPADTAGVIGAGGAEDQDCPCEICLIRDSEGRVTDVLFVDPGTGALVPAGDCPSSSSASPASSVSASSVSIPSLETSSSSSRRKITVGTCANDVAISVSDQLVLTVVGTLGFAPGCQGWQPGGTVQFTYDQSFTYDWAGGAVQVTYWLWKASSPIPPSHPCDVFLVGDDACDCCDLYYYIQQRYFVASDVYNVISGISWADGIDPTGGPGPIIDTPFVGCAIVDLGGGSFYWRHLIGSSYTDPCLDGTVITNDDIFPTDPPLTARTQDDSNMYACCPSYGVPTNQRGFTWVVEEA